MRKILLLCLVFFLFSANEAAAKVLPQAKGSTTKTVTKSTGTGGSITISPKLRGDRRALLVSFGNLQSARAVSYALIYQTNGQQEGAGGAIATSSNTASRELLFGTCSTNICRYHSNITNAKLEVSYTTKAGKKLLKRYKIKI